MSVTRNFGPLPNIPLTNSQLMREIGLMARERIVRRTRAGQGTDGASFQPYSQGYAERKQEELGKSSPVNLTVSGSMLNDIQLVRVTEDSVELGFSR